MAKKKSTKPEKDFSIPPDHFPAGYEQFLGSLKDRIRRAQIRAALSVNRELVLLYWEMGRDILARQHDQGWGVKVIDRLAADLKRSLPEMSGFSSRNLKYMRSFATAWPEESIVQQLVAQIPWGHNVRLLDHVKDPDERAWCSFAAPGPRIQLCSKPLHKSPGITTSVRDMNVDRFKQHFPVFLGLASTVWRFRVELLLAAPFVGIFLAVVAINEPHMFLMVDFLAIVILPLLYMVLLLMIRQSRPPK